MTNTLRILERHINILMRQRSILALNPPQDLGDLAGFSGRLRFATPFYTHYRSITDRGIDCDTRFEHHFPKEGDLLDFVIIFIPKSKSELLYWFELAEKHAKKGSLIWIVGAKEEGVSSAPQALRIKNQVRKIDSARHCQIWEYEVSEPNEVEPKPQQMRRYHSITIEEQSFEIATRPGVFSEGRLDTGTLFLLQNMPSLRGKCVLDLGCGTGVISSFIGNTWPGVQLTCSDINLFSILATRDSLVRNQLEGSVIASDVFSDIQGTFSDIISNPPFHQGKGTDYEVPLKLFDEAPLYLSPNGQLVIVANVFLDYEKPIRARFGNCEIIAQNRSFKVLRASLN